MVSCAATCSTNAFAWQCLQRGSLPSLRRPAIASKRWALTQCSLGSWCAQERLMEHLKLFSTRLNVPQLIRVCEELELWKELTFL